jgi:hypothetical protein
LTPTNLSRIEWLSREYPEMVEEVDGRLTVVVSKGEKVNNVMKLVGKLTEEWAEDNGLDSHLKAPQQYLGMLRQPNDPFWLHELGWGL